MRRTVIMVIVFAAIVAPITAEETDCFCQGVVQSTTIPYRLTEKMVILLNYSEVVSISKEGSVVTMTPDGMTTSEMWAELSDEMCSENQGNDCWIVRLSHKVWVAQGCREEVGDE